VDRLEKTVSKGVRMKRSLVVMWTAVVLALVGAGVGGAQVKPLKKMIFAVTTKDISVGHAAHTSLPLALGYWKDEGLDVEVASVEGSAAGLQQIGSGNIHVVSIGPEEIVIGREKGVKIKGFYVQARTTIFRIVVPADSPIRTVAELKGKTIGVPALASGSVPFAKALVASVGVDPEKDINLLAVGVGAPGALALQQKKVDALALWDTLQASLENRGLALRRLDLPMVQEMIGQTLATGDAYFAENPDALVGFARGVAKATVFGLANPQAAVRIHWKTYPQTRPQTGDEAKLLKEAIHVFDSRFELQRVDTRADTRFGIASPAQWQKLLGIYKEQKIVQGTVPAAELYSDKLVDAINRFDQAAIIRQAKEYKP
jgi:NitT/TauT family transport system substrate-binding protein